MFKRSYRLSTTALAGIAGLLYCSWPLGYSLNPAVARRGLASELGGTNQPYAWVFILGDVLCGVLMIAVAALIWRGLLAQARKPLIAILLWTIIAFAIGTIADALLPLKCSLSTQACPSFHQDHLLLIHGLISILAANFLFLSLLILWWRARRSLVLTGLMIGYVAFSVFSVIGVAFPNQGNWAQHYYLTLCGVVLACFPWALWQFAIHPNPQRSLRPAVRPVKIR
ncbi:MAG: hypothetical protein JWO41_515 [Candidatus Saccharibacteria bacterium]|nr:hypothetical protein [Candidatus Saccharibacteria bacterium]